MSEQQKYMCERWPQDCGDDCLYMSSKGKDPCDWKPGREPVEPVKSSKVWAVLSFISIALAFLAGYVVGS